MVFHHTTLFRFFRSWAEPSDLLRITSAARLRENPPFPSGLWQQLPDAAAQQRADDILDSKQPPPQSVQPAWIIEALDHLHGAHDIVKNPHENS
jgi:hypothetical protein